VHWLTATFGSLNRENEKNLPTNTSGIADRLLFLYEEDCHHQKFSSSWSGQKDNCTRSGQESNGFTVSGSLCTWSGKEIHQRIGGFQFIIEWKRKEPGKEKIVYVLSLPDVLFFTQEGNFFDLISFPDQNQFNLLPNVKIVQ
jgi:hypothetical protein